MRKIAIVGAGAVGSTLGALLDQAREQVYLIGRKEHVQAIRRERGLRMDGIKGDLRARVQALETLDFRPDLVLLTVKTQDVTTALESIKPYIDGVPVLTLQNGIRSDELAAGVIGREHLMSGVILIGCNYLEPGRVSYVRAGRIVIGPPFPECRVPSSEFLDMLTKVMPTTVTSNIRGARWMKLIGNLNNAIPAVTGQDMKAFASNPALCRAAVRLMQEGARVTRAHGVTLEPLPDTPAGLLKLMLRLPVGLASRLVAMGFRRAMRPRETLALYGSTLQSLKRGKPTEIDYLNGEIVRTGHQHGIPTPYNERAVAMVHEVERTGRFLPVETFVERLENG